MAFSKRATSLITASSVTSTAASYSAPSQRSNSARMTTMAATVWSASPPSRSRAAMERNLAFLGTVGNNAPFVGLLGTVIGIIRAFAALDQDNLDATGAVMAEVGEALVATAIGLLVALPAVVFYNYYQRVIRGRLVWADAMGRDVVGFVGADPAPASASKADKASGKEKS